MVKLNHHYSKLNSNPQTSSTEDFFGPLTPTVAEALENASREMGSPETCKGYGPRQGYPFLREAIASHDYKGLGIESDELFISDGATTDLANFQEIFGLESRVAVTDPAPPLYIDVHVMAGRTRLPLKTGGYGGIVYLPCTEKNRFTPEIPNRPSDLIYLSSPTNPTGVALDRSTLTGWVHYAKANGAVILFDGSYEAYLRTPDAPRSIYEIPGAKEVAVEVRSFSKTAGFTGLRCSYTVVPHALKVLDGHRLFSLHSLWTQRQQTKSNGISYPVQKAAAALYSEKGQKEIRQRIDQVLSRAKALRDQLTQQGYKVYGGIDAPFLWVKGPFQEKGILATPGSHFGPGGEGFVRLQPSGAL